MRIAVYAFDGVTMFHLSIPQMVFSTVNRLGLADWRVSLFTTGSEPAMPAEDSADSAAPVPAPSTASPSAASIPAPSTASPSAAPVPAPSTAAPSTASPSAASIPAPSTASPSAAPVPAPSAASIRTSEGYVLSGLGGPESAREADVVVVPAWFADGRAAVGSLRSLLREAHDRGASVVGLCLGAIPLAEAGLIGGRRATTHWRAFEPLAREHPEIRLDESVLYVDHGDVLTSAGAASGLDACLHLVRTRLGSQAANEVARQLVIAPHREGGQAQYVERPVPRHPDDDAVGRTMAWALEHLAEPLTVKRLASAARMSTRSFIRAFREAAGTAPATWVRAQRVREAQRLLESTELTIERVAAACGFGSAVTMRQAFARALGTTPSDYRRRFRTAPPRSPSTSSPAAKPSHAELPSGPVPATAPPV